MRIILYTGKGGVGKTSIAAASALKMAEEGKKVLIMSTDAAHSLGDSFNESLSSDAKKIAGNLYALEIDAVLESERAWENMKDYMKRLLTMQGDGGIETEELLVFPGLEELFSLFRILYYYEEGSYDVLVVDCAPTGETLSLLKYPQMLSGFMEKILPIKKKSVKLAGPAIEKITKIPMPDESFFDDLERVMNKMEELQKLLLNKEIVSIRIVTTPEKIVIREAKRNFTCLNLYNYNVDAIIVNRIYPNSAMEGYFNKWIAMQEEGIQEIQESFSEIPKFYLELQEKELRTLPVLEEAADQLFSKKNPADVLFLQEAYRFLEEDGVSKMRIYLPFAEKAELDLRQSDGELLLGIKNERRRFPLPKHLIEKEIEKAEFAKGYLTVTFV